jgi:hypothetical protein
MSSDDTAGRPGVEAERPGVEAERPAEPETPETPAPGSPMPDYKGQPLDPGRGPGLGCFWIQVAVLAVLLVATPLSVILVAPPWLSAALLIITLVLLLFVGQTAIFLMRLVAADRRSRRRPMRADAKRTVGQLEDETERHDGEERPQ